MPELTFVAVGENLESLLVFRSFRVLDELQNDDSRSPSRSPCSKYSISRIFGSITEEALPRALSSQHLQTLSKEWSPSEGVEVQTIEIVKRLSCNIK